MALTMREAGSSEILVHAYCKTHVTRILLVVTVVRTRNPLGLFFVIYCEMCSVVGSYKHGNEPVDSVKRQEIS
jgi:hypothetical protein